VVAAGCARPGPEDFLFALRFQAQVPVSRKGWWAWI
jgi:hypothetical protein